MKAAILYKTDEHLDCDRINIREQIEDILDDPNNFQLKDFSDETSMFELIHTMLDKPIVGVTACNIWENKNSLYAGYFIDITEIINKNILSADQTNKTNLETQNESEDILKDKIEQIHKNTKLNLFGSQVTSHHVTGNLVIIKKDLSYKIINNNIKTDTLPCSLSKTELVDVIENIFVKKGIAINVDGSMDYYQYIMNPLEHLMLSDPDYAKHYVYHEYEIYTHVLMIIADTREINTKINSIGSFLAGSPVNGTVFIAMYKKPEYNENPPYVSLMIEILNNILSIRRRSTSLTTGMSRSDREYINFEKLLELENIKHIDKPLLDISQITGPLLNLNN
jgi:hypothetical protein